MNKNMEQTSKDSLKTSISEALLKLKEDPPKKGVKLMDITKKLSLKKFGKK